MLKKTLRAGTALAPLILPSIAMATAAHEPDKDIIVVTATPIEKRAGDLTTPVSVVTGEELEKQLRATLGETLRREPGISSTSFGAGASRPIIRGLGGDRVRTLINGIGSIDAAAASDDHAVPIEPVLAETIEIVRGSGLLRYGSNAAGGVINVLDGRIAREAPEGGYDLAGRLEATTVDDGYAGSLGGQVKVGEFSGIDVILTGSAFVRDAEDYDIPGFAESATLRALEEAEEEEEGEEHSEEEEEVRDTLENSFNEIQSFTGGISFVGDKGFLGFAVQQYDSEYGIPGGHGHEHEHEGEEEEGEEEEEGGVFIDLEQTRYDLNASIETEDAFIGRFDLYAGYADYTHTEFEGPGEPGTVFSNEGLEVRLEAIQNVLGNWRGGSGVQVRTREFSSIGEEAFVTPSETEQVGFFTFQEVDLGNTTLEGALRYEFTDHTNQVSDIELDFDAFSASGGASYKPRDGVTLTANVSRTERAPTTEELFSDGPHLATNSFDLGNTDLDIETATGVDLGAHYETENFHIGVSLFYTDYEDFIYQQATGQTGADILLARGEDDEEELEEFGELTVLQWAAADARFQGFEVEVDAALGSFGAVDVAGDLIVDYVDAELDDAVDGSENLPRIPPLGVTAGLDFAHPRASLRAEVEYGAEVDEGDTASFELPTDSYTLVNFYTDIKLTEQVSFAFDVLNATDEEVRFNTSFLKDVAPLAGRNYRFALKFAY